MARSDPSSATVSEGNLRPTAILDYPSAEVRAVVRRLKTDAAPCEFLHARYHLLRREVRPVYTVDELQPTSRTSPSSTTPFA